MAKAMPSGIGRKCLLQLLIVVLSPADKAVQKGCPGAAWVIVVCVCYKVFCRYVQQTENRC